MRSQGRHGLDSHLTVETASSSRTGRLDAAIYARTSGAASKSIVDQISIGRRRCREREWNVRYILKDENLSGGDPTRPAYQALWNHVIERRIQVVVTWKIDRIARSLSEMAQLEEALRDEGVALHSCTEPIDTTHAQGRFLYGILASAAQLEREMGSERVRAIVSERARRGMWMHPVPPFGYCLAKGRALRIHPTEGPQVRDIFAVHSRLGSYAETAAHLNACGSRRRGRRWTAGTVQRVIENGMHIGTYTHWGESVTAPRLKLVTDEQWATALQVRSQRPRSGKPASATLRDQAIENVFDQYLRSLDHLDDDRRLVAPRR